MYYLDMNKRHSKSIVLVLFIHSIRSVMYKYLEERDEITFEKIFKQKLGKYTVSQLAMDEVYN